MELNKDFYEISVGFSQLSGYKRLEICYLDWRGSNTESKQTWWKRLSLGWWPQSTCGGRYWKKGAHQWGIWEHISSLQMFSWHCHPQLHPEAPLRCWRCGSGYDRVRWVILTDRIIGRNNIFEVAHTNLKKEAEALFFALLTFQKYHIFPLSGLIWSALVSSQLISLIRYFTNTFFQQVSLELPLCIKPLARWMLQRILTDLRVLGSVCLQGAHKLWEEREKKEKSLPPHSLEEGKEFHGT